MGKFYKTTKLILKLCGILSLFTIVYIIGCFFVQLKAVKNSDNGWEALGLVIILVYFRFPSIVLNIAMAIYSFVLVKKIQSLITNEKSVRLRLSIPYLVLAVFSGALLGLLSFCFTTFEPFSIIIGILEVFSGVIALVYSIKSKKHYKIAIDNDNIEM